jgi:hypothetical protein
MTTNRYTPVKRNTVPFHAPPIERPDLPGVDGGGSPQNLALAAMLNPTSKKDDKKPKPAPEASIPCVDGEFTTCTREKKRTAPTIPDFKDASVSGETIGLPTNLTERLVQRAGDNTECGKKIRELINTVAAATGNKAFEQSKKETRKGISYIESLFDENDTIRADTTLPPFRADAGTEDFVLGGAKIRLGLATTEYFNRHIKSQNGTIEDVYDAYVTVLLHELVHRAGTKGKYTDVQLLNAAIDVLRKDGHPVPERSDVRDVASSRFNDFFKVYCPTRLQIAR